MEIKLTQYSKAAGCGCKLSPSVLSEILSGCKQDMLFPSLLVGNETKDDAAVYELPDGTCVVSTTDFFTPIVDDPYDFGRIAATNAISDIYAMGGKPVMAIAILVWPIDKIPAEVAQKVIQGALEICTKAGIPLGGGHSIDNQEPIFGLAVTGTIKKEHVKKNNQVQISDILYFTKPLGIGILGTAQKRNLLSAEGYMQMVESTTTLNKIGEKLGTFPQVHAMTDVTGFGFVGHLLEMLDGSTLSAIIQKNAVPVFEEAVVLAQQGVTPGGTIRNHKTQATHFTGLVDNEYLVFL
jgi:selenide, water dikinase